MGLKTHFLILLEDSAWSVTKMTRQGIERSEPAPLDPKNIRASSGAIRDRLAALGYRGQPLLLALGSSWCVNVAMEIPTARQGRKREALAYQLESYLPWAAEEIVADYEIHGSKAFAVAAHAEPLALLLSELQETGAVVESISPLARLALEQYLSKSRQTAEPYALVWGNGATTDIWWIERDRPQAWCWVPHNPETIRQSLERFRNTDHESPKVFLCNVSTEVASMLSESKELQSVNSAFDASDTLTAASQFAASVLDGSRAAPIELRRDALASKQRNQSLGRAVGAFQLALLLLIGASAAALYLRGEEYDALRRATAEQQGKVFQKLFPDVPVPVGVRSRLESEYSRLAGVRGERNDLPDRIDGVVLIERLLRSLPSEMRCRILEVRVESGRLQIVGQVRDHSDADRIAEALRKTKLVVDAPKTHLLTEKGVEFRITARITARIPEPASPSKEAT